MIPQLIDLFISLAAYLTFPWSSVAEVVGEEMKDVVGFVGAGVMTGRLVEAGMEETPGVVRDVAGAEVGATEAADEGEGIADDVDATTDG